MVILNKTSIKLPRVERDTFILLLRLGLDYNREIGYFSIKNYNNIDKLIDTIARILDEQEIAFLQTCIICKNDFACNECAYVDSCKTSGLPFHCVCPRCLKTNKTIHPVQQTL